jgi:hypothetical protein
MRTRGRLFADITLAYLFRLGTGQRAAKHLWEGPWPGWGGKEESETHGTQVSRHVGACKAIADSPGCSEGSWLSGLHCWVDSNGNPKAGWLHPLTLWNKVENDTGKTTWLQEWLTINKHDHVHLARWDSPVPLEEQRTHHLGAAHI